MLIESFHVSVFNMISKQHVTAANRNSPTEVFLGKVDHDSSPIKTPFPKNTLGALILR